MQPVSSEHDELLEWILKAITNFDASTAHSEGRVFGQTRYNGQFCFPVSDPNEGCEINLSGNGGTGCIE
jgi:hypothetical protein